MKKFLTGFFAMTLFFSVNAQTEKGDWMIGGNMTIKTATNNSEFSIQPMGGYFFARNFVAGAELGLSFGKTGDQKTTAESVGPYTRYYFGLKDPAFKPFLHAEYIIGNMVTRVPGAKSSNTVGSFFGGAGAAFFISSNVALEGVAGYSRSKVQGLNAENGFLFRLGFQVHLLGNK